MSEEEVAAALEKLRRRRGQEQTDDPQPAGTSFEPATQIQEILATAKDLSKRYGLLLPFPFNPFDGLKLPASRPDNDVLERLPKVTETVKPEPPKPEPTILCSRCGTPHNTLSIYCSRCGGCLQSRWEPDHGYTMRK